MSFNHDEERTRKWDLIFLAKAAMASTASKDPSTKVGASIKCYKNRVVSEGYNGLPQGMYDDPEILNNRDLKYRQILHAEENAILSAERNLNGMTLYTYPIPPCLKCTSVLIQSGITRVVSIYNDSPRWKEETKRSEKHLKELNIETKFYKESEVKEEIVRNVNDILGIDYKKMSNFKLQQNNEENINTEKYEDNERKIDEMKNFKLLFKILIYFFILFLLSIWTVWTISIS